MLMKKILILIPFLTLFSFSVTQEISIINSDSQLSARDFRNIKRLALKSDIVTIGKHFYRVIDSMNVLDSSLYYKVVNKRFGYSPVKVYSYHDNLKYKSFSLLFELGDGAGWESKLFYYSNDGNLISNKTVAYAAGDEGMWVKLSTVFLNDSTFQMLKVRYVPVSFFYNSTTGKYNEFAWYDSITQTDVMADKGFVIIKTDSTRFEIK